MLCIYMKNKDFHFFEECWFFSPMCTDPTIQKHDLTKCTKTYTLISGCSANDGLLFSFSFIFSSKVYWFSHVLLVHIYEISHFKKFNSNLSQSESICTEMYNKMQFRSEWAYVIICCLTSSVLSKTFVF